MEINAIHTVNPLAERKADLRKSMKALRRNIDPQQKQKWDQSITAHLLAWEAEHPAALILCYASCGIEVDTRRFIETMLTRKKPLALPKCSADGQSMGFYLIRSLEEIKPGPYGVPEPDAACGELVSNFASSICVTPALAVDHARYRLGFGGGYYDAFLAQYPGQPVALCYGACELEELPREPWDRPVDAVIREEGILLP